MSTDVEPLREQTAATLVSGILSDLQHLVDQQFQLMRREVSEDLGRRAAVATVLGLGVGVLLLDAIMICLTLVHLLHWWASPPGTDSAWLPLWGCHAVLAVILAISGGVLVQVGRARSKSFASYPSPETSNVQEPVRWTTHPK